MPGLPATALIGISSVHLLKSFIKADTLADRVLLWQVTVHVTVFVLGAGPGFCRQDDVSGAKTQWQARLICEGPSHLQTVIITTGAYPMSL